MRRLPPTRFIPQDAVPLTVDGADAIVYLYDHRGDQPCAIAYAGKANRPAWHRIYSSRDKAERLSREWLTGIAAAKDANTDTGNSMACYLLPAPGRFLSDAEPIVKHPQTTDGKNWHIAMEYGWCDKWNGRPNYCSWYA